MNQGKGLRGFVTMDGGLTAWGLHVGSDTDRVSPRGVDAPVLANPMQENGPYLSASALKGKLRHWGEYLYASQWDTARGAYLNKDVQRADERVFFRHECPDEVKAASCLVCGIFGAAASGDQATHYPRRLTFRHLMPEKDGVTTEVKAENAIVSRMAPEANPRRIERLPMKTGFRFQAVYTIGADETPQVLSDRLCFLLACMRILEDDYVGGNGSRGYGKVAFGPLQIRLFNPVPVSAEALKNPCVLKDLQAFLRGDEGRKVLEEAFFQEGKS